jgi:hypothetical protein
VVSGSHTYGQAGSFGSITHDPIFVFVHDVGGSSLTIANTANLAFVPFPKVTDLTFSRLEGLIQVTFQEFSAPSTGMVALNQATLHDANNYLFTKFRQHGPAAYKITAITVSPPEANGAQVVTLQINGGRYLRGGHYFLDVRSVSPTNRTGIQDVFGNALDGEFYGFFPSGNNVPGGDFIAELDAVHHTIFAPKTLVGTASPVVPPGTKLSNTTIATFNPGGSSAKTTAHVKASKHLQSVPAPKVVHKPALVAAHSKRPLATTHVINKVHHSVAAPKVVHKPTLVAAHAKLPKTATPVIDNALHQLSAEKHHHS